VSVNALCAAVGFIGGEGFHKLDFLDKMDNIDNTIRMTITVYDMKTVKASDAKQKFGQLIDMAQRGPVRVTSHDRPVAVMLSIEDYDQDQDRKWKMLQARLRIAQLDIENGQVSTTEQLRKNIKTRMTAKHAK